MRADELGRRAAGSGCEEFETHLPLIEDVTASVCRRQCLRRAEAEDFSSSVKVYLLDDDCAVLNKFDGRSKLSTYLTTVIFNLARDQVTRERGRWRPSAMALRLGVVAVQLEILTVRDGWSLREAAEMLRRHHGVDLSVSELADLAAQLPARTPRPVEHSQELDDLPQPGGVESRLREAERARTLAETEHAVAEAFAKLTAEERLILKLRYREAFKISAIARTLGLRARPLYPKITRLLESLRRDLQARGLSADDVLDSLGWAGAGIRIDYSLAPEAEPCDRPSNPMEEE